MRMDSRSAARATGTPMENLPSFMLAGIALTGSPGPNTLGLAAASAAYGLRGSLRLMAGSVVGVFVVMAATATGLTGLVLAQPGVAPGGRRSWPRPTCSTSPIALPPRRRWRMRASEHAPGFGPGLFLGLGNPKAYAAMAALYSGFTLLPNDPVADAVDQDRHTPAHDHRGGRGLAAGRARR